MPLKGVPDVLSPDILHALASSGHGDYILLADSNFPSAHICRSGPLLLDASGVQIPQLLEAILKFYPLDTYVNNPVILMDLVPSDTGKGLPPVWDVYSNIIAKAEGKDIGILKMERFAFYEYAKKAFAVIRTSETAQYGNIILTKGVVLPEQTAYSHSPDQYVAHTI